LGLLNSAPAIFGSTTLDPFILQSKFVNTERIWGNDGVSNWVVIYVVGGCSNMECDIGIY